MLKEREKCNESCILPNEKEIELTWTGKPKVLEKGQGSFRNITLLDAQFAEVLPWNFVTYGKLEAKGCQLKYQPDRSKIVQRTSNGAILFKSDKVNNVLVIETNKRGGSSRIMDVVVALDLDSRSPNVANGEIQSTSKVLTVEDTTLVDVAAYGSPCSARVRTGKELLAKRSERGAIIGKCDKRKRYNVYLPKPKTMIVTQHVRNADSMLKESNKHGTVRQKCLVDEDMASPKDTSARRELYTNAVRKPQDLIRKDMSDGMVTRK
uniref:AlNc14C606G12234 protein n=1 Tax=Albugo laibachii Nc14 TaxID=890382 RepID=F0X1E3_9STRA|nr:AlNc14C606G12234 [Albugo laibachii Nc14]|eukprot:CCA27621.1 AlNc14C606G12234 [Albugo laibachii Nc14]